MKILNIVAMSIFLFLLGGCSILSNSGGEKCLKYRDQSYREFQEAQFGKAAKTIAKGIKCDRNNAGMYELQAAIHEAMGDHKTAIRAYQNCLRIDSASQPVRYQFAAYLYRQEDYKNALLQLDTFDLAPEMNDFNTRMHAASDALLAKAKRLKSAASMAMSQKIDLESLEITNLGPNINTSTYEYWPGMPIDGNTFVFTRLVRNQEDFYFSKKSDGEWSKAVPAPGRINTRENEGTSSVFQGPEDQVLYYTVCNQGGYGSCDLYYSKLDGKNWGPKKNMGAMINSSAWDAQPSISGDGNTLVFASARPGGMGGKDIWIAKKVNGKWQKPKNAGPTINTRFNEEAPFLHYDGTTLYFSSDGHQGFGKHDFFLSRKNNEGDWTKPKNLGKGINTPEGDVGFYVDARAEKAYFASERKGGYGGLDIYSMTLPDSLKPLPVNYLLGKIIDKSTKRALKADVRLVDVENNKILFEDNVDHFLIPIVPGKNYALISEKEGYLFDSRNFQPTKSSKSEPFEVIAELEAFKQDQVVRLSNIFFDVDKFNIKLSSIVELKTVIQVLKKNPSMRIEISGHTDNTGSDTHNKELSQNRANAVVNYLVEKGIDKRRLVAVGYGASKPSTSNETVEGRARNRRIEMRILELGR